MSALTSSKSDLAELLTIASTLVSQNIWGRHQRAALKELLLSGDQRTVRVSKLASGAAGDSSYIEPIFEALDDLVFEKVATTLTKMGYQLTAGSDSEGNNGRNNNEVSRSFEELKISEIMKGTEPIETTNGTNNAEDTINELRNTWFGAVVAGLSQARPLPSGGKCCCIGSGAGLLAFASVFFADFSTVVGIENDTTLHERAVDTHRLFEREFRARSLDSSAPRPVELIFYNFGSASLDTLDELRNANVIVVDGTRVDSPHALAAVSADSCRPGTIVISLDISFPESDFEMLHSEEFSTMDWGASSVTVRVQRRKGSNRSGDPAEDSEIQSIDTSMGRALPSPSRRPKSPPMVIPGTQRSQHNNNISNNNNNNNNSSSSPRPMTTPQRLARNEQTAHISSPQGSSLLNAKRKQSERNKQSGFGTGSHPSMRIRTPDRPSNLITRLSGSYDSNGNGGNGTSAFGSLEASSPISGALMMRKMKSSSSNSNNGGALGMPSFSPKMGSPLSGSLLQESLYGNTLSQPSSPMGAALLRRKQSGQSGRTTIRGGPISISSSSSSNSNGNNTGNMQSTFGSPTVGSPLRHRVVQHPVVPNQNVLASELTEEVEAPSSPMSSALLRKKRLRQSQQAGNSPLRMSSSGGRTKSGGTSPTFRNLSKGFFDKEDTA